MKIVTKIFFGIFLSSYIFITGCSDKTEQIIGSWKSTNEVWYITGYKYQTCTITKNSFSFDESKNDQVVWKYENDHIAGYTNNSGQEQPEYIIKIINDDRIAIWWKNSFRTIGGNGEEFIRSTPDEVEAIIKSPIRKIEEKAFELF